LFRGPDPGCERRDPIVRRPDTGRLRAGRTPLPARQSVGDAVGKSVGRAIGATQRGADTDTDADADAGAHTSTADASSTDAGRHACPFGRGLSGRPVTES
jgi:hypothetical protein